MIALLYAACTRIDAPSSDCACDLDFSSHPRAAELQAVVDDRVAQGLPGLSVAVRTPDGLWAGAAGYADLEHQIPMTPCHVHHYASVAKTWYATLALLMQEQGMLNLDGKLSSYLTRSVLDGVPNADVVTLRQLMNHTSGIPDFNDDVSYIIGELNDPTHEDVPLDLIDAVRGKDPLGAPGAVYHYADTNYVLLALAITSVTGDAVASLHDEIIARLGLEATAFYTRGAPEPACIANTYWEIGGGRLENVSDLSLEYATHDIGADGLATTPLDALTFVETLVKGDLLSSDSLAQMRAWSAPSQDDAGYGYGLGLARTVPDSGEMNGHTGGGVGTGSVMRTSPDRDVSFSAATNVGLFLGGPLSQVFDETLWDDLAVAGALPAPE